VEGDDVISKTELRFCSACAPLRLPHTNQSITNLNFLTVFLFRSYEKYHAAPIIKSSEPQHYPLSNPLL